MSVRELKFMKTNTTITAQDLRNDFDLAIASYSGKDLAAAISAFEAGIAAVHLSMNAVLVNAENWQMIFDLLHWDWCAVASRQSIPVTELDRITLKYSRFGEHQEAVVHKQIESAKEWAKDLFESGISLEEALSLSFGEAQMIVHNEQKNTGISKHPSPVAIPQAEKCSEAVVIGD
jgi:hypothetical protein